VSVKDTVLLRRADLVGVQEGEQEGENVQVYECVKEDEHVNDGGVGVEKEELGEVVNDVVELIVASEADNEHVDEMLVSVGVAERGLQLCVGDGESELLKVLVYEGVGVEVNVPVGGVGVGVNVRVFTDWVMLLKLRLWLEV